jgi:hypothetical protein
LIWKIDLFGRGCLQSSRQWLCSFHGEMDWLAKILYPRHPKLVRFRKLQALCFTIVLCVAACAVVGLLIFLMSNIRGQ